MIKLLRSFFERFMADPDLDVVRADLPVDTALQTEMMQGGSARLMAHTDPALLPANLREALQEMSQPEAAPDMATGWQQRVTQERTGNARSR